MKKLQKVYLKQFLLVFIGCLLMGLAYSLFIIPHHFVPGGVSGLAIIVNYFSGLPVGALIIVLNIPIFLFAFREMGKGFVIRGVIGMVASSLTIDFFNEIIRIPSVTDNKILAAIYGGILLGAALGFIFRAKYSTGGSDIVGQILNKTSGISVGFGILIVDFFVISLSGLSFQDLEAPLYGYLVLLISSKVIDLVLEGISYSKMAIIVSAKNEQIEQFILSELDRSGTALKSRSLYLNREGEIIMTVIHKKQLISLRNYIKEIDPEAFVIINDTYDVLGKGFKSKLY